MSDIDTEAVDSLKVLDPNPPIREADTARRVAGVRYGSKPAVRMNVGRARFAPNTDLSIALREALLRANCRHRATLRRTVFASLFAMLEALYGPKCSRSTQCYCSNDLSPELQVPFARKIRLTPDTD